MAASSHSIQHNLDDSMGAVAKGAEPRDGTPSSIESTPEPEGDAEIEGQPAQPVKRKGGRKPIYATSEERKQRNRQAQAAFRERRTEYIKQLEATIKQNEDSLSTLQQSHRAAADECLMLRYKNSLLERILLEKGIDVQAELQIKTGSPLLGMGVAQPGSTTSHASTTQTPLQRTAVQRQHARWSGGPHFLPKLVPGGSNQDQPIFPTSSPQGHPTPPSHASSPNNGQMQSPLARHQGGMTPPTSAVLAQPQQYQSMPRQSQQPNQAFYAAPKQSSRRPGSAQHQSSISAVSSHSAASQQSMNPSMSAIHSGGPPEQEYDTHESHFMLDGPDQDEMSPDALQRSYPPQYNTQQPQQPALEYYQQAIPSLPGQQQQHMNAQPQYQHGQAIPLAAEGIDGTGGQLIDPNDPMLDADPFGLSASMHYPTSYTAMTQQQQPPPPT